MENAAQGLIIAGSVLIAIMIIGMGYVFYDSYSSYPALEEERLEREQLLAFNAEYESYAKTEMYGTDLITVINKVIDNNDEYKNFWTGEYEFDDNMYYIDVEFKLISDVNSYATKYSKTVQGYTTTDIIENNIISGKINGKGANKTFKLETIYDKNSTFNVFNIDESNIVLNDDVKSFFKQEETFKIQQTGDEFDEFNYTMIYSGLTDFKRKYFTCLDVEYNEETGRVNKLVFEEIPSDN